jgi:hypothetical protein
MRQAGQQGYQQYVGAVQNSGPPQPAATAQSTPVPQAHTAIAQGHTTATLYYARPRSSIAHHGVQPAGVQPGGVRTQGLQAAAPRAVAHR